MANKIAETEISFTCRFHPTDGFHEVGCPHQAWTREQLQEALILAKKTITYHFNLMRDNPELFKAFHEAVVRSEIK